MRIFSLVLTMTFAGAGVLGVQACSSESSESGDGDGDGDGGGGAETSSPGADKDSSVDGDDASTKDSSTEEDAGCTLVAPSLDAGGGCGTMEFGAVAAPFTGVDAGDGGDYVGGVFPAGVYDAVGGERNSGNGGSWRETFVSDGNGRFTRIRQIDMGAGAGPGAISRRSGTYAVNGNKITFTEDCLENDGVPATPGSTTGPYEVLTDKCETTYRYGFSFFRITLKRR